MQRYRISALLTIYSLTAVYSPRRFPGMLEPTELSKKLASQGESRVLHLLHIESNLLLIIDSSLRATKGIKIAVRSDKKKRRRSLEGGAQEVTGEVDGLDEEDDE